MLYKIYVSLSVDLRAWAFIIVNQQGYTVYGKNGALPEGNTALDSQGGAMAYASFLAADYFSKYVKRRYYTEHFSEKLGEDEAVLFAQLDFPPEVSRMGATMCAPVVSGDGGDFPEFVVKLKALMEENLITPAPPDGSSFSKKAECLAQEKTF